MQSKKNINLAEGLGTAIREYQTDAGPADYVLFVNKKPSRLIKGHTR
jgi:type I restriction enzyme R subunit